MKTKSIFLFSLLCSLLAIPSYGQFEELTRLVPSDANLIILVNHENLMASPFAQANDWATQYEKSFAAGVISVPPGVEDHVLSGSIDLELGIRKWEIALIKDKDGVTPVAEVARMFDGKPESIAGVDAIVLPGDTYLVQFSKTIAGGISPSNRQDTSRWIRAAKANKEDSLSGYLKTAASYSNKYDTDVVISVDLQDAIAEHQLSAITAASKSSEIVELLRTIKGVTLGINVKESIQGKLLVDFATDAAPFKDQGKELVLQTLGDFGMMIEDVKEWTASSKGNRFALEGELSEKGMRRLMTFCQPSGFSNGHAAHQELDSKNAKNIRYLQSVFALQRDFQDHDGEAIHLHTSWLKKTIEKLDSVSVLGVDDDLTAFAANLSDSYSEILNIVANEKAKEQTDLANTGGYGYAYRNRRYGRYYGGYTNAGAKKSARDKDKAEGTRQIKLKLNEINSTVRDFRTAMSKKFETDF
jgi:hypothetical protein